MDTLRMGWRNIWRNRRRTGVTVAAMTLALFTMVMYSGLVEGYLVAMEKQVVDVEVGDIQVHHDEYRKQPSLYSRVDAVDETLAELDAKGYRSAPRLIASGLAAAGDNSAGVMVRGINVERDKTVSAVYERVSKGAWLTPGTTHEVVLGAHLAKQLGVEVGGELILLSQAADGSMANDLYTVKGLVKNVSAAVDRGGIYMLEADFRELFTLDEGAHQIIVRLPDGLPLDVATKKLRELLPTTEVENWRGLMPTLAQMLDSSRAAVALMFVIIYMAIGIVVFNATLMAVFERIREFGVLKALGVSPWQVMKMMLFETGAQTLMAVVVGVLISIPVNTYLVNTGLDMSGMGDLSVAGVAFNPIWHSTVTAQTYTTPIIVLVSIIALATIYPAARAALIRPVEAMRQR
jgi:ABC-type lipoprotein release transport system permease subunit